MSLFHRNHKNLPAIIYDDITKPHTETNADKAAEAKSEAAWTDRKKIVAGTGVDELKAQKLTKEESGVVGQHERADAIRSFSDAIPTEAVDDFNTEVAKANMGIDTMPDMNRVHTIGKHVIEVADVTPTPERIEVHLGHKQDVA